MKFSALFAVVLGTGFALTGSTAQSPARPAFVTERAVLVMRHGIRAPLSGEVPDGTRTAAPWPKFGVPESRVTPHGARALEIVAGEDRKWLAAKGLLDPQGCLAAGTVRIASNSSERTIDSGEDYARGFAPGCAITVEHRPVGTVDPMFEPLRARATTFDAKAAIADIDRSTGGMTALVQRHAREIAELDRVLGCGSGCVPGGAPRVSAEDDGHGIALEGPIRGTSGVAQVLLLQYVEGLPARDVGWGRIDAAGLKRLGALHAALFAVFTRPPYMAAHQAALLGRRVLRSLQAGPKLDVLMGHDTNVTAVAGALDVDLVTSGYATNDVPPGGALLFERVRETRSGRAFVRVSYRTQSPEALRSGGHAMTVAPLRVPGCGGELCPVAVFERVLSARLAAVR